MKAINIKNATVELKGQKILDNLNFEIEKGEKYFILGANGAGKTTLVKLILGYIWARIGGKVEILDKEFGKVDIADVRKQIAWVSPFITQHLEYVSTGLDMVLSGLVGAYAMFRKETEEEMELAKNLLEKLGALDLANKNVRDMSSGELIKILIARAFISKPKLMILDEPTVYLDMAQREMFLNYVDNLIHQNPDLTVLFISQRIEDILPVFSHGMILHEGKIKAQGTREEILTSKNLKEIFGLEMELIKSKNGRLWGIAK